MHLSLSPALWTPASRLWQIATIILMLGCLQNLYGGETANNAPSPKPFISDQEWSSSDRSQTKSLTESPTTAPAITSMVISLLLVAGLAIGLGVLAKRLGIRRMITKNGQHLHIIEQVTLSPKRTVSVVRIGDQVLLLGLGEHELSHLATLPASVLEQSTPNAQTSPSSSESSPFQKLIDRATGRTS